MEKQIRIIDISPYIEEGMIVYPGDAKFRTEPICTIERSGCNMTKLFLGTHTGSHIDAPFHFLPDGASVDKIPLSTFIGPAQVIEVKEKEITRKVIEERIDPDTERVLFKTENSYLLEKESFSKDYTYLTEDGARLLAEKGIKLVGIDYISIERFGTPDFSVHKILFKAGICILEGINLKDVRPGHYILVALPLKLKGLDGSPVRAVLIEKKS